MSPILSNIYLNELDEYMAEIAMEFNKGKHRPVNPEYNRVTGKMSYLRKKVIREGRKPELIEEIQKLKKLQMKLPSKDGHSPSYKRLWYCRYADDFIAGVIGSKEEAYTIKDCVVEFLKQKLNLEISEEKTTIKLRKMSKANSTELNTYPIIVCSKH